MNPLAEVFVDRRDRDLVAEGMRWASGQLNVPEQQRAAEDAPDDYEAWVQALFPRYVRQAFSRRHHEFWEFVWRVRPGIFLPAFIPVWPRGGGKTTTAELGTTAIGVRDMKRYAWYVTETQDKANNNVRNIGSLLESPSIERYYPAHAERALTKYGHSKGWTSQRLTTAGGFTVDGIGLDTAQRGLKVEDQRPDLIILDDIDGKHDSLQTTAKKIDIITTSILPAGSTDCVVIAVQNLILANGFFTRLVDGRADYLTDRILSGPVPALEEFKWEWRAEADGVRKAVITAGEPTWAGQGIAECQALINRIGITAFRKECQHEVKEMTEGLVLTGFDQNANMQAWSDAEILEGIATGRLKPFGMIDYGYWRFAFLLAVIDRAGRVHIIDEYFSQKELLQTRAEEIDKMLQRYGISALKVYGDPANPQDALEFNKALERLWKNKELKREPRWRVSAATKDKGSRTAGPDRINDMFDRRALLIRRGIGGDHHWFLGMNASSAGEPMKGSRFMWELGAWSYPDPREGEAQKQDPDDHTADGADMMAALRYGILSQLKPKDYEKPKKKRSRNMDDGLEKLAKRIREQGMVA